jgi:hypothetical protein
MPTATEPEVLKVLRQAKELARRYHELTGKPLGVTGEIAEYEAHQILGVELTEARNAGYDATEGGRRLQIKGRCILPGSKPGQRVGSIDKHKKWDAVLLVLLDENLEATAIYEAPRAKVLRALRKPGSRARNERGALAVSKFKAIAELRWPVKIRSATLKTLFCGAVVCFVRFGALKNRIVNPPRIPAKTVYRSATRAVSKRSTSYPLPSLTPSPALPRIPLGAVES